MNKYWLVLPLALATLTACSVNSDQQHTAKPSQAANVIAKSSNELHFVGPMDLTLTLESKDNYETAVLTDNSDRRYQLRSVPAANGIRMSNEQGVTIHFNHKGGVVELVPGKPISIQPLSP